MQMKEKKTILLAHVDEKEKSFIYDKLIRAEYGVLTAATVQDVMDIVRDRRPHLVLLSRNLTTLRFTEFIQNVRRMFGGPVLVFSSIRDEAQIVEALDTGAYDYLITPFGTTEHMARIRSAFRQCAAQRDRRETDKIYSVEGLEIDYSSRVVTVGGNRVHLTPIEFRILTFLTRNAGNVMTHEQIIDEIWGPYNSDNLVLRVNMANIRKKIQADPDMPQYIITDAGVGYMAKGRRAADRGKARVTDIDEAAS